MNTGVQIPFQVSVLICFFFSDQYPQVELLDHMVVAFSIFKDTSYNFDSDCANIHFHQECTRVLFSPYSHPHLLVQVLLITAILTAVR